MVDTLSDTCVNSATVKCFKNKLHTMKPETV